MGVGGKVRALAFCSVALGLVTSGCGSGPGGSQAPPPDQPAPISAAYDEQAMWRAVDRGDVSTTDVVRVGRVSEVAVSGQRRMVTYLAESSDDEGTSATAWRLYDRRDRPLAQGLAARGRGDDGQAGLVAVPGGFLLSRSGSLVRVDSRGRTQSVSVSEEESPTRAGDVLVSAGARLLVYRPSSDRASRLPAPPESGDLVPAQRPVLDGSGRVWAAAADLDRRTLRIVSSPDGQAPWHTTLVPVRTSQAWLESSGPSLTYADSRLTVGLLDASRHVVYLTHATSDTSGEALDRWRRLDTSRVPAYRRDYWDDGLAVPAGRGRVVVPDDRGAWWVGGPGHAFAPLSTPEGVASIGHTGGLLYGGETPLWLSADQGAHWRAVRQR